MNALSIAGCLTLLLAFAPRAEASSCINRLGLGAGVVQQDHPDETSLAIGAEYECRFSRFWGLGAFADHVFATPEFSQAGAPQVFLHPLGGDFYVAFSPLLEFGTAIGTHFGTRLSTRLPIPLGVFTLVPSFAVDFIRGGHKYWLGLGIGL